MFEYFTPVYSNEHLLNKKEIATLYGLYSTNDKPHTRLISKLFQEEEKNLAPIYYATKTGLMQVYNKDFYEPIITNFFNSNKFLYEERYKNQQMEVTVTIDNKTSKFKIIKK